MAKKSRQVENRIQSSQHVLTAAKTHRQQVAESLAARAIDVQGANTQATNDSFLVVIDFLADALGQSAPDEIYKGPGVRPGRGRSQGCIGLE